MADALIRGLSRLDLVLVTGKGGVGKSTVAVCLGARLAAEGHRVVVLEADPRENAHRLLGMPPSGGELQPTPRPGLSLQNLQPRKVLDRLVRDRIGVPLLAGRVLESSVYHHFAEGCPGLKELVLLDHARRLTRPATDGAARADVVVLDAPATGHGLALLAAPRLVADAVPDGPFGRLAREVADLVADPSRVGVVVVTTAEEMPVQETVELVRSLEADHGRGPVAVVVNALYPPADEAGDAAAPGDELAALWLRRRAINEAELARLARAWPGPTVPLPLLPLVAGPPLVDALAAVLAEGAAAPGADPGARR